jgi:hypothetical protein
MGEGGTRTYATAMKRSSAFNNFNIVAPLSYQAIWVTQINHLTFAKKSKNSTFGHPVHTLFETLHCANNQTDATQKKSKNAPK